MKPFTYTALSSRPVLGAGTLAQVPDEVRRLGAARALVLVTPQQAGAGAALVERLGGLAAGVFPHATMHTPVDVSEWAVERVAALGADCTIALGGGSSTGFGKAIALRTDLPQIAIPTTYAGSEATPILGETWGGVKITQTTMNVLPEVIVYDVDLTLTLPPGLTAASGLNAIAHAVDTLYARDVKPVTSALAEEAVAELADALPGIVAAPANRAARADALYGAWLCGICLRSVGMVLHRKLCHTLGGAFDLPHAETHAVVLPHAVA